MTSLPRRSFAIAGIAALLACGYTARAQTAPLAASMVKTQYPTEDYAIANVIATQAPYGARGDGATDCTQAIQSAIDTVAAAGGGVVFLPSGRYLCDGNLVLKEGVTLRGDWKAPHPKSGDYAVAGTILMPAAGRGSADGPPFIAMQRGTEVRDLSIWYPDQKADNVVPYPWTIALDPTHAGNNYTVHQVTLVNPYLGMKFGPEFNEMFTLRQVYGTPLKTGMFVDSVTDIARIIHLRFGPRYWEDSGLGAQPDSAALAKQLLTNATAIDFGRSDWQYFDDVALAGYAYGLHFHQGAHGATLGVLYGVSATGGDVGLASDACTLELTRCHFDGATAGIETSPAFTTDLQLNTCRIGGEAAHAISLQGTGSVRLQNCTILSHGASAAIDAGPSPISLLASRFPGVGPQVLLQPITPRAVIVGCTFAGGTLASIENHSRGDIQIDPAPLGSIALSVPDSLQVPDRKPATGALFDVLDYGAKSDGYASTSFDNTSAFQKALDAAGHAGGGTVYVPAGSYRFNGNLTVPTGVELRGSFDVPHHTVSMGSMLYPTAGRGNERGTPFISLAPNSGARGLTIWYPDQTIDNIVPYPWTIRSLGPKCWLINVTGANPYRFVDFGTYPSEGHLLRYVAGSPLRCGIWVSKGSGVVDSCHFNEHEWLRKSPQEPPLASTPNFKDDNNVMDYQNQYLDAYVFGACPHEIQTDNFVYGCAHGLRFVSDGGKACGGWAINPASDGSSTGMSIDDCSPAGVQIVNIEIATVGKFPNTALEIKPSCVGEATFFGGISFGIKDVPTMIVRGNGTTVVQGWSTVQSPAHFAHGDIALQDVRFTQVLPSLIRVDAPVRRLEIDACSTSTNGPFTYDHAANVASRDPSRALAPIVLEDQFAWGAGSGNPRPNIQLLPNLQAVDNPACTVDPTGGPHGTPTLVLTGTPRPGEHGIEYFGVFDVNIPVTPNTTLRYWLRPNDPNAEHTGIDLYFADGSVLRDMEVEDTAHQGVHPGVEKGVPGTWTRIEAEIGPKASGKTINRIVFAFDNSDGGPPFRSSAAGIEIGEPVPGSEDPVVAR